MDIIPSKNIVINALIISFKVNFLVNVPEYKIISDIFVIGPATIKTIFETDGRCVKELATKASAKEHKDKDIPSTCISNTDKILFEARDKNTCLETNVWKRAAIVAPRTRYLPITKKSFSA